MCEVEEEEEASSFFEVSLGKSRLSLVSGRELGWTLTVALAVSDFQAFQIRVVNSNIVNKWSFQPVQGSHDRSGMHRVRREPVLKEPLNLRKGGEGKQRYQDDSQPRPRQS